MYLVFRSRREKTTDNLFMSNLLTSTVQMCTAECLNITSFFNPQFNFGLVIDDQVLKLSLRVFCFFFDTENATLFTVAFLWVTD